MDRLVYLNILGVRLVETHSQLGKGIAQNCKGGEEDARIPFGGVLIPQKMGKLTMQSLLS